MRIYGVLVGDSAQRNVGYLMHDACLTEVKTRSGDLNPFAQRLFEIGPGSTDPSKPCAFVECGGPIGSPPRGGRPEAATASGSNGRPLGASTIPTPSFPSPCLECGRPTDRCFVTSGGRPAGPALPICAGHPPSVHRRHAARLTREEPNGTTENTNQEEVPTMSANTFNVGEVSGLQSAIDFADKLASASEESVQHLEQLGAGLQAGGTGSETVGRFSTAGDSLSAAAAALRAAVNELRQHMSVRESYEATGNQAGDKDFVTAE